MGALDWKQTGGNARVLLVATSHSELGDTGRKTGLWLSELTHPYFMLHDSGVAVDIVTIDGGQLVIDPAGKGEDDPDNRRFLGDEELLSRVDNLPALRTMDFSAYQGIFFAGGHGAMWDFPDNPAVQTAVSEIIQAGHVVAAVCHGVAALANVTLPNGDYLVAGKRLTAFTNEEEAEVELQNVVPFSLEDVLRERGAEFVKRSPWEEHTVSDGQVVTGQNPASGKFAGIAMVKQLRAGA